MEVYKLIKSDLRGLLFFCIMIYIIAGTFDIRIDNSDKDGFNRSGLSVHTDYKTGLQYLSNGDTLIPRLDRNNNQMRIDKQ